METGAPALLALDDLEPPARDLALPDGVAVRSLAMHRDDRGCFTEIFRREWDTGVAPIQWNVVSSAAGVLRGVHVHIRHDDYLVLIDGKATIGLRDLRPRSPTHGLATVVSMSGGKMAGITIPHGVTHGFYFHEPSVHVYAVSRYWDLADELGCHWSDPELRIPWPMTAADISPRDASLPSYAQLLEQLRAAKAFPGMGS